MPRAMISADLPDISRRCSRSALQRNTLAIQSSSKGCRQVTATFYLASSLSDLASGTARDDTMAGALRIEREG